MINPPIFDYDFVLVQSLVSVRIHADKGASRSVETKTNSIAELKPMGAESVWSWL